MGRFLAKVKGAVPPYGHSLFSTFYIVTIHGFTPSVPVLILHVF